MSKIEVNQIEKTSTGSEITVLSPLSMDHPLKIKVYTTTAQITALTASTGQLVFDAEESSLKIYDGTQWSAVGAGGGSDEAFAFSLIGD